jgi:hypothetical protein
LLDRALKIPNQGVAERVVHTIAQFRHHTATVHDSARL